MKANPGAINSGSQNFDQMVSVLMGTSIWITAEVLWVLFLDNTIPGQIVQQINQFKTKSFDEKIP